MLLVVRVWDPAAGGEYEGLVSLEYVTIRRQARAEELAVREALARHPRDGLQARVQVELGRKRPRWERSPRRERFG